MKFFEGRLHRGRRSRGDRYDDTMDGPWCQQVFYLFLTRLRREGSEGSEGSKGSEGSEGGGIALAGDEYYNSASRNGKPYNRASPDGNAPLLTPAAASLHGKASHTILSRLRFPTNRVRLPPRRGRF